MGKLNQKDAEASAQDFKNGETLSARDALASPEINEAAVESNTTDKINRSKFTSLKSYKAVQYYALGTKKMRQTTYWDRCPITPAELQAETDELEILMEKAKASKGGVESELLAIAVRNFIPKWNTVATYTETTYPRDTLVASIIGLEYNEKPGKNPDTPPQVTNVAVNKSSVANEVLIAHASIKGFRGALSYVLFVREGGTGEFREMAFSNNAKGIPFKTVRKQEYEFYVAARNSKKVYGPPSDIVTWIGQ